MSSFLWVRIATELSLIRSTITAWAISNVSAFLVILLFTRSLWIALMTTLCIFFIVVCLLWFMVFIMQWPLGAMEALSVTIFVGMACDYCLHIAHSFMHSEAPSAHLRVRQALTMVGNSVLGAAITTIGSCVFLLFCVIVFFKKMGVIIIVNTIGSLFFALVFFPAMLSIGEKAKTVTKAGVKRMSQNAVGQGSFGGSSGSLGSFGERGDKGESEAGGKPKGKQVSPTSSRFEAEEEGGGGGLEMAMMAKQAGEEKKVFSFEDDGGGKAGVL